MIIPKPIPATIIHSDASVRPVCTSIVDSSHTPTLAITEPKIGYDR
jgi:hypothetical protein